LKKHISAFASPQDVVCNPPNQKVVIIHNPYRLIVAEIIKSPFTFELLGMKAKDIVEEPDLEQAIRNR